jgi:hypothetical protein
MFDFLKWLSLRLPHTRTLAAENQQLQSRLRDNEQQLDALRRELAQPRSDGLWVPQGHFYSPIADPKDEAVQRALRSEECTQEPLGTFGIEEDRLLYWFNVIAEHYAVQPFPEQPSAEGRYYYANPNFPLADALALLAFMVRLRPKRLIEAGSGYSSCAAIDINERYLNRDVDLTFIDPHPDLALQLIGPESCYRDRFMRAKLQDVPTERFARLERGDILFIDSSHVSKTGSDVLDYLFRVIPSLSSGVIVHIHDIFYPFEYPRAWIEDQNRSWNEAYLVRACLEGNSSLRVLYMSDWFYKCRRSLVEARMPLCIDHRGGSLWIEKL